MLEFFQKSKLLRFLAKSMAVLLILFVALVLFVRSPWGQDFIVHKVVDAVSEKTGTEISLERVFITFAGDIAVEGLYLADLNGDTLLYFRSLQADLPFLPLIKGKGIDLSEINLDGLSANVCRIDTVGGYNFQFLLDAFPSDTSKIIVPDTASAKTLKIALGLINFTNINLKFKDDVMGIDSRLDMGHLSLDVDDFDLDHLNFALAEVRMTDADVSYLQTKAFAAGDSTEASPLPHISVDNLILEKVKAHYNSTTDGLEADVDVNQFAVKLPMLDIANSHFEVDGLQLSESTIAIYTTDLDTLLLTDSSLQPTSAGPRPFVWPSLTADIQNINLLDNTFLYAANGATPQSGQWDPNAILMSKMELQLPQLSYTPGEVLVSLDRLAFAEGSGIVLNDLGFDLKLADDNLALNGFGLAIGETSIQGKADATYPSMDSLLSNPNTAQFALLFQDLSIDLEDVFQFAPELRESEQLHVLSKKLVRGQLEAEGSLAEIEFGQNDFQWGPSTKITFDGRVQHILSSENLHFILPNVTLSSTRNDIMAFIHEDSLGIKLPEQISIKSSLEGGNTAVESKGTIRSTFGDIAYDASVNVENTIAYEFVSTVSGLRLEKLLQNEQLGPLSLSITSSGSGDDIQNLDATLEILVQDMVLNNYAIKDLSLTGSMQHGEGSISSQYKDENLNAQLDGTIRLDSIQSAYSLDLNVIGVDLEAMGVTQKPIRTGFHLMAEFAGDFENFELNTKVDNGTFVYDNQSYRLGDLDLRAHVSPDSTSANVSSNFLEMKMESNTDPASFSQSLIRHIESYFEEEDQALDTLQAPVRLLVEGRLAKSPILSEIFLDKLQDLDTVRIAVEFDEAKRLLNANITAPHIDYDGYTVDTLQFRIDTHAKDFTFDLGFEEIEAGAMNLKRTTISGNESNGVLDLEFNSYDDEVHLIHVRSKLDGSTEQLHFSVDPDGLIFNKEAWTMPADNELTYFEDRLRFHRFVLSNENQSVELTDQIPALEKDHVGLVFERFQLSDFLSFFNPDEKLASGQMQGNFVIEDPFNDMGFTADLEISQLAILAADVGLLRLNAASKSLDNYKLNLSLKEGQIDLDLLGEINAAGSNPTLDLELDLNRLDMKALQLFSGEELSDSKGFLTGQFTVNGPVSEVRYEGQVHFNDIGFNVNQLNSAFSLPQESINLNNESIHFDRFTVLDVHGNSFDLSGDILTKELFNPTFDLKVNAKDFQVLDATREDNDLIFGQLVFDANGSIKGNTEIPVIDLDLAVGSNTNLTYVLPSSVVEIERMDGVVVFVNKQNPDAILTRAEEVTASLAGYDINAHLKIGTDAHLAMILDEETGDNFQVSGLGDLQFGMEPNGRMTLAGVYDISSGSYEMNLYGVVDRRFELSPDSKVSWSGDPFDADMDIRAVYKQEASCAPLMASVTTGLAPAAKSQYRQVLPFYVYLDIAGSLTAPEISFALDMPEDERGALGGQVYGRVQQVNQQEEELNKQVFSLLVLSRFYPEPGSDGSAGGVATVARDNLNDALSDQLNVFSDKLLGQTGVELDFGIDSYTDYQSSGPQERTQLEVQAKKTLFDDRLTVSVASEVDIEGGAESGADESPVIGKVSLEYTLTPDGRYILKGFRKNEFENVIDGQIIISGIALIFTQEFNQFDELWRSMLQEKQTK